VDNSFTPLGDVSLRRLNPYSPVCYCMSDGCGTTNKLRDIVALTIGGMTTGCFALGSRP